MKRHLPDARACTIVTVVDLDTCEPVFDVMLYGVTMEDVCVVAAPKAGSERDWIAAGRDGRRQLCGAEYVRQALRRRGLDPDRFTSSIFMVQQANRGYAVKRERLDEPVRERDGVLQGRQGAAPEIYEGASLVRERLGPDLRRARRVHHVPVRSRLQGGDESQ